DYIMLIMGSAAGTAKEAVDELRDAGVKAGVLKLRVFRPFPEDEIAKALRGCKAVAIMDRCESYNGNGGPLSSEVCAALYRNEVFIKTVSYVYGLAGRDFTVDSAKKVNPRPNLSLNFWATSAMTSLEASIASSWLYLASIEYADTAYGPTDTGFPGLSRNSSG
ncbi:MAG: hypothetical protein IJL90_02050, partial [Lachnospiraceae bacterium]|nr:hypothetical protein [Lachnospiraceae bacterium]